MTLSLFLSMVLFIVLYKVILMFESVDEILKFDQWKLLNSTFNWFMQKKVIQTFEFVDEMLKRVIQYSLHSARLSDSTSHAAYHPVNSFLLFRSTLWMRYLSAGRLKGCPHGRGGEWQGRCVCIFVSSGITKAYFHDYFNPRLYLTIFQQRHLWSAECRICRDTSFRPL